MNNIYSMTAYYNLFKSPVAPTSVQPITNFVMSAKSSELFAKGFGRQLQSSVSQYLQTIKNSTEQLIESSKNFLNSNPENVLTKKIVTSDDNSINGFANSNAESKAYTINVSQLATSQINNGKSLNSNGISNFNSGQNIFNITKGNSIYTFDINLNPYDSNITNLGKIAQSINKKNIGISANVEVKNDKSFMNLTSKETGIQNSFYVNDVKGNIVETSGINQIKQEAKNAEFKLNNIKNTSTNNTITVDKNISLSLKGAKSKDIQISVDVDKQAIKQKIKELIVSYNNIITAANNNIRSFNGASILKSDLQKVINQAESSLQNIGLYSTQDGTLEINYNELDTSIGQNIKRIKEFFNPINNLAEKLIKKGSEIINSPIKYSKPASFDKNYDTYMNYMKLFNNSTSVNYQEKGSLMDVIL